MLRRLLHRDATCPALARRPGAASDERTSAQLLDLSPRRCPPEHHGRVRCLGLPQLGRDRHDVVRRDHGSKEPDGVVYRHLRIEEFDHDG